MFFGKLVNLAKDKAYLAKPLVQGLDYLARTDFSKVEAGRYEIEGDSIFALVQEYRTAPKGEKKAETHAKYIDIQYIDEGTEIIGFALANDCNEVEENLLQEKDAVFYKTVNGEADLIVGRGQYAIFFPGEIHRPGCNFGSGSRVRKVVVKIKAQLLEGF